MGSQRTARRVVAAIPSAQGQRVRVWAISVGQPSLWRTIAIAALPSTTCSGTALQCVQVNTAATVSVCAEGPSGLPRWRAGRFAVSRVRLRS
jgi:hypothetical protein